jgi:hypothetical protein
MCQRERVEKRENLRTRVGENLENCEGGLGDAKCVDEENNRKVHQAKVTIGPGGADT